MIIYKRRRIFGFNIKTERRNKSHKKISGVTYTSISYKRMDTPNRFLFSEDGLNSMPKSFLWINHYFAAYQFIYREDKDYDELVREYLMFILEPSMHCALFMPLWDIPNDMSLLLFDRYRTHRLTKDWVDTELKGKSKEFVILVIMSCLYLISLFLLFPILLLDSSLRGDNSTWLFLSLALIFYNSIEFNEKFSLYGAMNVVFHLPNYDRFKNNLKIIQISTFIVLLLVSAYVFAILKSTSIEDYMAIALHFIFQLAIGLTTYKKLFSKKNLYF